jgi:hypothetical protein
MILVDKTRLLGMADTLRHVAFSLRTHAEDINRYSHHTASQLRSLADKCDREADEALGLKGDAL